MHEHRLPSSPRFWRSPLRGTWFTSVLGVVLLAGITVLFVTGLLSYAAYNPDLSRVNDKTPDKGLLGFYLFDWPTDPVWLYRFTQGVHVTLGVVLVPVLLAKLWSVVPKLFAMPPARSLAHGLERLSLLLLVGGALFQFVTGLLNIQLDYIFPGSFYRLHFYGAWVFFAAFALHAALRTPTALRTLRAHRHGAAPPPPPPAGPEGPPEGTPEAAGPAPGGAPEAAAGEPGGGGGKPEGTTGEPGDGKPEGTTGEPGDGKPEGTTEEPGDGKPEGEDGGPPADPDPADLAAPRPDAPTVSRRGALWFVGGGSLLLFATTVGRSFDGPLRTTALLAPHGWTDPGSGPGGFQINKTAASRGIRPAETTEDAWRLTVTGPAGTVRLSRAGLLELPLHSAALPIACVEGWSTSAQWWRGVRLRDLAELAGYRPEDPPDVLVESLQRRGSFRIAALRANQVADGRSLLALDVNGEPLTPDHGFPARVIVPNAPGVLNTKWVTRLDFGDLSGSDGGRS
ncbi:molybdopterin-dependent oxidoreductase [Streptomyces sp. C10-9-1]|uniref:molybdopterin-dependent oxidoreductase n=1 Tax=Streptomyces sp. C10-9-1 TaxID=1859285 RepID=UPI003D70815E